MGLGGRDDLRRSHHLQLSRQRQRTHSFRNTQGNREQVWTQVSHWVSKLQAVDNSIGDTVPVIKPSVTVLRWHSAASPFILSLLKFVMLSYFFVLPLKNVCVCVCVCVRACVRACVCVHDPSPRLKATLIKEDNSPLAQVAGSIFLLRIMPLVLSLKLPTISKPFDINVFDHVVAIETRTIQIAIVDIKQDPLCSGSSLLCFLLGHFLFLAPFCYDYI